MAKKRVWQTWYTSDPHFGHINKNRSGVISFCNRPFEDMEHMMDKIREDWNKLVSPEDQVIFVGDIFFYWNKPEAKAYMDSLNGRKILVRGNHDRKPRDMNGMGFDFVCESMEVLIGNERVTVSHFPFRMPLHKHLWFKYKKKIWNLFGVKGPWVDKYYKRRPKDEGQFLIHGHTHTKTQVRGRMIHVGMDAWNFKPVPLGQIGNLISEIRRNEGKE